MQSSASHGKAASHQREMRFHVQARHAKGPHCARPKSVAQSRLPLTIKTRQLRLLNYSTNNSTLARIRARCHVAGILWSLGIGFLEQLVIAQPK